MRFAVDRLIEFFGQNNLPFLDADTGLDERRKDFVAAIVPCKKSGL